MNWINLGIKTFCRLYLHEIAFNLISQQLLYTKQSISGSQGKKHDFEMFMPSCWMCCTRMVHFIGVQIIKSCSSSQTP